MTFQPPPATLAVVAEVLVELSIEIEALGAALCRDPGVAAEHLHTLQAIDLIGQKQQVLASLLTSGGGENAIAGIGIEQLRRRFDGACMP